jgi:hypothetical protein
MSTKLMHRCLTIVLVASAGACGGGNKDKAQFQAAVDSMTRPRDSTIRAMDSAGTLPRVDTTKLGAAKTESILTKARKAP